MKWLGIFVGILVFGAFWGTSNSASAAYFSPPLSHSLSPSERSALRYKLENLYNEVDLLIRNRRSDEIDLQRQEQTAHYLKIYDRIPFEPKLDDLRAQLISSAATHGLKIRSLRFLHQVDEINVLPRHAFTDDPSLKLSEDQIAGQVRFRFDIEGDKTKVREWIRGWPDNILRLLDAEGGVRSPILQPIGGNQWEVEAWAFRFREIRYPRLELHDPQTLLPAWARENRTLFAKEEPILWHLVEKSEQDAPEASGMLSLRGRFLLNDARISFFLRQTRGTEWASQSP